MKINQGDIGRWATIKFDCVGQRDVLIVDVNEDRKHFTAFEPFHGLHKVDTGYLVGALRQKQAAQ
jgi:hypothetical protein